jgi:hypothetical protein
MVLSVSLYDRNRRICAADSLPPTMAWNAGSSAMRCSSENRISGSASFSIVASCSRIGGKWL